MAAHARGAARPRVGVTTCGQLSDYLDAVREAGGDPVVVRRAEDAVARGGLDALVLTGGSDIDPALYGQSKHQTTDVAEPARDALEIDLARDAVERDLPLLAICRGIQVLNVALGGTLIQDLPSLAPAALDHDVRIPKTALAHDIVVSPGSKLADLLPEGLDGAGCCRVNSRHHQALDRVAPGLQVVATAPDGVIEAVEHRDASFCLGVQWHPENFTRTGEFRRLFDALVAAARRHGPR
jgi:putative glutamine amidotransferase